MTRRTPAAPVRALYLVALVSSALVLGLTLSHVLQSPGSRGLGGQEWLAVQHTFYTGFAVVGAIAEVLGFIAAATLAVSYAAQRRTGAAVPPLIAALCLMGTLLAYWFGNRPVNERVDGWTIESLPPDWSAFRDTWEIAHGVSAGLAAIAFLTLAVALVWRAQPAGRPAESVRPASRS